MRPSLDTKNKSGKKMNIVYFGNGPRGERCLEALLDNKYVKRSRISVKKFRQLVKLFSLDLRADHLTE